MVRAHCEEFYSNETSSVLLPFFSCSPTDRLSSTSIISDGGDVSPGCPLLQAVVFCPDYDDTSGSEVLT